MANDWFIAFAILVNIVAKKIGILVYFFETSSLSSQQKLGSGIMESLP